MNKAPAFQFYVADYMQDTRCLSLAAKGAWTDCLCAMWRSQIKGTITFPLIGFARLFGCTVEQAQAVIDELVEMQTCDRVTHDDGKVTLINRRMQREAKEREAVKNRVQKFRKNKTVTEGNGNVTDAETTMNIEENGKLRNGNENVTSYSSSSDILNINIKNQSSRKSPKKPLNPKTKDPPESHKDYIARLQGENPHVNVESLFKDYRAHCKDKGIRATRRHFGFWVAKEEEPMELPEEPPETYINPMTGRGFE